MANPDSQDYKYLYNLIYFQFQLRLRLKVYFNNLKFHNLFLF
jgi:hypothetical protein